MSSDYRKNPPTFGTVFHGEMPLSKFINGQWQPWQMVSSNKLEMHPAMHVLHYGSACFEGAKAFRQPDDRIAIFRLADHIKRMATSAGILSLPAPTAEMFWAMALAVVASAKELVPDEPGALYLRPTLFGIDENVGKAGSPSDSALFYILTSPVGDYFKVGTPMKILIDKEHGRCAPHMGQVKTGGNYASALVWQKEAKAKYGASQVLFCPHDDVQETGASNFILIDGNKIITKNLTSEFLHGITRDSVLTVARDLGYSVEERGFTVEEILDVIGRGGEAALTGTAAVIAPISAFILDGREIPVASQERGLALRKAVMAIQFGHAPDKYNWLTIVD